ncbi:PLDc N-terminal domain-containing protein [Peptoniphilus sp.]|uniref:PLDc N-terminal domain-containing protein n=1 Tax=Peptoniphilus sp. TaxID=1971214 RepID=UPI0039940DAB
MNEFYEMIRPMLPVYIGGLTVYLVLVIYCILSIVRNSKFDVKKKVIWTFVVVLVQIIGPIAYLAVGRKKY